MNYVDKIKTQLNNYINKENAQKKLVFYKTGKNEYGEGDKFLGISVPNQRKVVKQYYKQIQLEQVQVLIQDKYHEYRLSAILILVYKYEKTKTEKEKKAIYNFYIKNYKYINNWDLVDASAYKIMGAYLFNKNKDKLFEFAHSKHLWKQRIAIVATYYFIKQNQYDTTLEIAKILLNHKHDLIQKAVGWMIREIGNRNLQVETEFLKKHYKYMPKTMLRYAIEKFDSNTRKNYYNKLI